MAERRSKTTAIALDPILGAIETHERAYARLDVGLDMCTTEDELAAYFDLDADEGTARTELVMTTPTTAAGARALIAYTLRCFRRQHWDDAEIGAVLSELLKSVPLNIGPEKAVSPDPILEAIEAHARARAHFYEIYENYMGAAGEEPAEYWKLDDAEMAARDRLSLTAPTTAAGAREMIGYTLSSFLGYDGIIPTMAAVLSSLMRSTALSPNPAEAAA